jgi:hypothetical protein
MRFLVNYDYNMKILKTHWYILMLYPFESIRNPFTIVLSSYFHILEARAWHLLSCICIFKNVFTCILNHAIIQYYATKSKIFLLLIIKVTNIHEFDVWSLNLYIPSTQKNKYFICILYHAFTHYEFSLFLESWIKGSIMAHNVIFILLTLTHNYTIHFQHIFNNNFPCKNIFELHNHTT